MEMRSVLSTSRTKQTIDLVLNKLIPGYKKIDGDYAFNFTTDQMFGNEEGVVCIVS
jgi:hypothetical protein